MTGLAIGSFLNVLIDRLPQEELITGRSHCDHCKKDLAWYDLMPILSYVYLGARCRYCGKKLSFSYPLVEAITGVMFVFVVMRGLGPTSPDLVGVRGVKDIGGELLSIHTQTLALLALLGILSCGIVIFFSDLKYQVIPDSIEVSLFAFSFLFLITEGVTPKVFLVQVVAAFVVTLPILLLFLLTKGKAMGFGDVKLSFNIGFLLGIMGGLAALYIGFITGAIVGLALIFLGKKKLKSKIAFGPFLIIGLILMLFFADNILPFVRSLYLF